GKSDVLDWERERPQGDVGAASPDLGRASADSERYQSDSTTSLSATDGPQRTGATGSGAVLGGAARPDPDRDISNGRVLTGEQLNDDKCDSGFDRRGNAGDRRLRQGAGAAVGPILQRQSAGASGHNGTLQDSNHGKPGL